MLQDTKPKQAQVRKAEQQKDTPYTVLEFSTKAEMLEWRHDFVTNADAGTRYRLNKKKHAAAQHIMKVGCVVRWSSTGLFVQHQYKTKSKWIFFKETKCVHCGHKV